MTCNGSCGVTAYNALADFLLGLPNNGTGSAVSKAEQSRDPNSLRWSEFGVYTQDQWSVTPKLTIDYGIRYEYYPPPYKDHTGPYIVHTNLPQTGNVEIGGVNGNPESAGLDVGRGNFVPRLGVIYSFDQKTIVRTGFGMTTDPDSYRVIRDAYPGSITVSYSGSGTGTVAVDPANNNAPMTLTYGIPKIVYPSFSSGFVSLPVAASTQTAAQLQPRLHYELESLRRASTSLQLGRQRWLCRYGVRTAACHCHAVQLGAISFSKYALHGQRPVQPVDRPYRRMQFPRQHHH
jgi:hypothetical protein